MASIQTVLSEKMRWHISNKSPNDLSHSSIINTLLSPDLPKDLNVGIPTEVINYILDFNDAIVFASVSKRFCFNFLSS